MAVGCKLTSGLWTSYYDGQEVNDPAKLDIDHMVPLAEAWDSGASAWDAKRREAYANDQDAATSLVAVTARSNRAKADRDPAEWMPPLPEAQCRYIGEWTATAALGPGRGPGRGRRPEGVRGGLRDHRRPLHPRPVAGLETQLCPRI